MSRTHRTIARSILALALGAAPLSCAPPPSAVAPTADASSLRLRRLDGTEVALSSYRGKVVLLDVWATWCEPCRRSLPFYAELRAALGARGFEVLAVSVDESEVDVRAFLDRQPLPFPVFHDPGGDVAGRLGAQAMPSSFLLDRDGKLRARHGGFASGDEAIVRQHVQALLDEAPSAHD